jgi:hypothetical protein
METTFRKMKKLTSFEEYLNKQYGEKGNSKREKFENDSLAFRLEVQLSTLSRIIEIGLNKKINISIT